MKQYAIIFMFVQVIHFCNSQTEGENVLLSRKKRYLHFPEGSAIVINVSFSNVYVWRLTDAPRAPFNAIMEMDLGFKLPNNTRFRSGAFKKTRRDDDYEHYYIHRSERRELYYNLEALLDLYGVDGHICILRTLCEAKRYLRTGRSFVEDILHVVFTFPGGSGEGVEDDYDKAARKLSCKTLNERCPLSLLKHLLS